MMPCPIFVSKAKQSQKRMNMKIVRKVLNVQKEILNYFRQIQIIKRENYKNDHVKASSCYENCIKNLWQNTQVSLFFIIFFVFFFFFV